MCTEGVMGQLCIPSQGGDMRNDIIEFHLGSPSAYLATVPEGFGEGDEMTLELSDKEEIVTIRVPPGKQPGSKFGVAPRLLLVEVPLGSQTGDWVSFKAPDGTTRMARVPGGVPEGHYFDEPLDVAVF